MTDKSKTTVKREPKRDFQNKSKPKDMTLLEKFKAQTEALGYLKRQVKKLTTFDR